VAGFIAEIGGFLQDAAEQVKTLGDLQVPPYTLHPAPYTLHPTSYT